MTKNKLFGLAGISLTCFMLVGANVANAESRLLYSYVIPKVPGTPGESCTVNATRDNTNKLVRISTRCGDNDAETVVVNDGADGADAEVNYDTLSTAMESKNFAKKTDIPDVSGFQTAQAVKNSIAEEVTSAKLEATLGNTYLKEVPSTYATKTDVQNATTKTALTTTLGDAYLTEVPSTYATKTDVQNATTKTALTTTLGNAYATSSDVNTAVQNATTKTALTTTLGNTYATSSDVNTAVQNATTKTALTPTLGDA